MTAQKVPVGSAPRVLISRLSSIGDVVHGLPVLCALRRAFPESLIGWVVEDRASALLRGHEALDELITLPRGWLKSPRTVWNLRRHLRRLRFDVTIDLQGLTKSAVAARLSGARWRIGFGDRNGRELSKLLNNRPVNTTARHVIDMNLELLRPLGIERSQTRFLVPERREDRTRVERIIGAANLREGFAVLNPGAGWPSKLWPAERFAAVAAHLGRVHRLPSMVVWAGREERASAEHIVAGSRGWAQLAPPTSLTELATLARRGRLFVGSDTGPLHIATAVGTPCVGLYGPMSALRNGPYGPQHVALQKRTFEGTSRQRRSASAELMEAIRIEHVCDACDEILGRQAWKAAA
ncbi:MAG: glycosyltransferase family 9 protein [Planctomycetes bacterium]|nr:glycosyltransferase family 9 protein [Planctomycetota bacterium]